MIKEFYKLAKPGIIYGNSLPAIGGFFLALNLSTQVIDFAYGIKLLFATLLGLGQIIASACVFNNILDCDIDAKMDRTKNRALVLKTISKREALIYASMLLFFGSILLIFFVNFLAFFVSIFGFISYVFVYTPLKRTTIFSTLVGAFPGAVAPVVGYVAVTNNLDLAAILLFVILFFWQMPHFYSIAVFRENEYLQAGMPTWPIKKGLLSTYRQIIVFIVLFFISGLFLSYFKYTGYIFAGAFSLLGLIWLKKSYNAKLANLTKTEINVWAKNLFKFSLVVLLIFCVIISIDKYLPI